MAFSRGQFGSSSHITVEAFPYWVSSAQGSWTGEVSAVTIRQAHAMLHKQFSDVADRKIKVYATEREFLLAAGYSAAYIDAPATSNRRVELDLY